MSFSFIQRIRNTIKIKNTNVDIKINKNAKLVGCRIYIKGKNATLHIGKNTTLRNCNIEILNDNSAIIINDGCMIGDNCYLVAKEGTRIVIKNDTGLSRNVKVMTSDGHPVFDANSKKRINEAKDIVINEKVWIADNVTILKGVEIGKNCVVGINSTLTKSIPDGSIAAGNPAKVIKNNIYWEDKF